MGKKRLLALMCAVSILLTTFMPLSALGDEGAGEGEVVVTEAQTEEAVSLSETGEGGGTAEGSTSSSRAITCGLCSS